MIRATRPRASTTGRSSSIARSSRSFRGSPRWPMCCTRAGHPATTNMSACLAPLRPLRLPNERLRVLRSPLDEVLVPAEHSLDDLVKDVLGVLANECGVRVQGLAVLLIETCPVLHDVLATCARFDHGHRDPSRSD